MLTLHNMCRLPSLCPWWWMMVGGGGLMTFSAKLNFILSTEVMSLMRICYSNTLFYSSSKTWSSNALFYSSSKAHHFNDRKRLCSCRYKLMSLMRIYSSKICSFKPLLDHVHVYVDKNWENEKNSPQRQALLMPFFHHQSQLISIIERGLVLVNIS